MAAHVIRRVVSYFAPPGRKTGPGFLRACSIGNNRKPVYESSFGFVVRLAKSETGFGNRRSAQISGFVGFNMASAIYNG